MSEVKKKHTVRNVVLGVLGAIFALIVVVSVASNSGGNPDPVVANPAPVQKADKPAEKSADKSKITKGQEQALRQAETYLNTMPFSKKGLVKQLKFEKFSTEDAEWAADNVKTDWDEQAVKAAVQYLDTMAFSEADLAAQLVHDGFTKKQAKHGASKAYNQ